MAQCPEHCQWKELIAHFLPRSCVKHTADIRANILAVDTGVKPSFLFDYCCPTSTAIIGLVARARELGLVTSHFLIVVDLEETLFIARTDLILQLIGPVTDSTVIASVLGEDLIVSDPIHSINSDSVMNYSVVSDSLINNPVAGALVFNNPVACDPVINNSVIVDPVFSKHVIVDVSRRLVGPRVLDTGEVSLVTRPMIASLREAFNNLARSSSSSQKNCVRINLPPVVNRTTTFGLMLGYPVLYWYETGESDSDDATGGDCLGHVPLRVNKATVSLRCCRRKCVDTELTLVSEELSSGPSPSDCFNKTVSSFSYPEELSDACSDAVGRWKRNVLSAVQRRGNGLSVRIESETVTLSVVAM